MVLCSSSFHICTLDFSDLMTAGFRHLFYNCLRSAVFYKISEVVKAIQASLFIPRKVHMQSVNVDVPSGLLTAVFIKCPLECEVYVME